MGWSNWYESEIPLGINELKKFVSFLSGRKTEQTSVVSACYSDSEDSRADAKL